MTGGNVTSINLASSNQKKKQSTSDILKQIESTLTDNGQDNKYKQEELSSRILGKLSQHEAAFGDQHLPRQRLPKVGAVLLDRYQAARRNVLLLGAINQVAKHAPRPNTNRSGKSSSSAAAAAAGTAAAVAAAAAAAAAAGDAESCLDDAPAPAAEPGLDCTFASFDGSRAGSTSLPVREADISPEASGLLGAEASQLSISSRKMRHQASGRSNVSSFAGSSLGTERGRLRHANSTLSTGSGLTQQSELTNTSYGSKYSRAMSHWGRKTPRKAKHAKPKPGRVAIAMAQFGGQDDWMTRTLLRHYLASVIQARWRGYQVRKRWADTEGRPAFVAELQAQHAAEQQHQQRLQEMEQKLQARRAKQQAEATAAAVAAAAGSEDGVAAGTGGAPAAAAALSGAGSGAGGSGAKSRAASARRVPGSRAMSAAAGGKGQLAHSRKVSASDPYASVNCPDSDSDNGWSDIELDDVASIKFRAVTPPWQKVSEQACMGQRLQRRVAAAAAAATGQALPDGWAGSADEGFGGMQGAAWESSSSECGTRLQELRHRRICRKPEPVQLSQPAVAAAAASGLLMSAGSPDEAAGDEPGDAAAADAGSPLPSQIVEQLLLDRYSTKYARMGIPGKMPGRRKWQSMQQEQRSHSPVPTLLQNAEQRWDEVAAVGQGETVGAGAPAAGEAAGGGAA